MYIVIDGENSFNDLSCDKCKIPLCVAVYNKNLLPHLIHATSANPFLTVDPNLDS